MLIATKSRWAILPVGDSKMKQLNTYELFSLGDAISSLKELDIEKGKESFSTLAISYWGLQSFNDEIGPALAFSGDTLKQLQQSVTGAITSIRENKDDELQYQIQSIKVLAKKAETLLSAELGKLDTYIVNQIGGYSMPLLVRNAEVNLPGTVSATIPDDARKDLREAGRCLAFELPTASGYHALRAAEKLLREYHELQTGIKPTAKIIDWKTCLDQLGAHGGDGKTIQVLDQIRELHRNPLAHPEIFLSMEDAQGLFNIVISAITAMSKQVEVLKSSKALAAGAGAP